MSVGRPRHKIARGAVRKLGRIVLLFLGLVVALVTGTLVALSSSTGAGTALGSTGMVAVIAGPLLPLLVGLLVFVNLPGWVEIGSDGVLIDWRGERQHVRFHELEEVVTYREQSGGKTLVGVDLLLREAPPIRVLVGEDQLGAGARTQALRDALAAALAAYGARVPSEAVSLPERGDGPTEQWLARLKAVGTGANAGPRDAPVAAERLWRVAEDPLAPPHERTSAAAALSAELDAQGRKRLRIAAAETASPALRSALESAAASDDLGLRDALDVVQPGVQSKPGN